MGVNFYWNSRKSEIPEELNTGRDRLKVAKKSVQKFAERIIMKLASVNNTGISRAYGSGCSRVNSMKGDLSIPEDILKYVKRWLVWIKSVYGKEEVQVSSTGITKQ